MGKEPHVVRPSWDETFVRIAKEVARRGTCPRAQVGAVIVTADHRVVSVGYNGSPAGMPHCIDVGCIKLPSGGCGRAVHAEVNALMQAGPEARGCTLYVTMSPCFACASVIVNAGIVKVVYTDRYRKVDLVPDPVQFLAECGIRVTMIDLERMAELQNDL
jgi:dCMP deaminase